MLHLGRFQLINSSLLRKSVNYGRKKFYSTNVMSCNITSNCTLRIETVDVLLVDLLSFDMQA